MLFAALAGPVGAHDTFMRLDEYTVPIGESVEVVVFHGTFEKSVYRLEWRDDNRLELMAPSGLQTVDTETWQLLDYGGRLPNYGQRLAAYLGYIDRRTTSSFQITPTEKGTHTIGFVLGFGGAAMAPASFDSYLLDVGLADEPIAKHGFTDPNDVITERYRKSVKTIFQVGGGEPTPVSHPLGLPVEFVPLANPFSVGPGTSLPLQLLHQNEPLANHPVIVGRQKGAFTTEAPPHKKMRSDASGQLDLPIDESGVWWVSFVFLEKAEPGDEVLYQSEWATLTFEIP